MTAGKHEFVMRVLEVMARYDVHDELFWRTDGGYAPISFFVNCSDTFFWGSADVEPVTAETLPELERAFVDAETAGAAWYGTTLYAARRRGARPQGAAYPERYPLLWELLDACGPEREVGLGNPRRRPGMAVDRRMEVYRAARRWADEHRHPWPDDRMLDAALAAYTEQPEGPPCRL